MADTTSPSGLFDIRRQLSGLEFFKKMTAGELPPPPLVVLLGLKLVEAEPGRVTFTGVAREEFYNGMGVAHGGFAATLLDSALGCAINTMMPAGRVVHDDRSADPLHPPAAARGRRIALHRDRRPRRQPHRDLGGTDRRRRRQGLRPRHDDVHPGGAAERRVNAAVPFSCFRVFVAFSFRFSWRDFVRS